MENLEILERARFENMFESLSDKYRKFILSYIACNSKSRAALDCGCPPKAAGQQGYALYNRDDINFCIKYLIKQSEVPVDEVISMTSAISKSNIMDYYVPRMVESTPKIQVGLQVVIDQLKENLEAEQEFFCSRFFNWREMCSYQDKYQSYTDSIAKHRAELNHNPNATRIIDGPTELVEELVLDLKLLQADRKKGRVKSVKYGKNGELSLELYSAAEAHEKILRMNGKYAKDNEVKVITDDIDYSKLSDAALEEITRAKRQ